MNVASNKKKLNIPMLANLQFVIVIFLYFRMQVEAAESHALRSRGQTVSTSDVEF